MVWQPTIGCWVQLWETAALVGRGWAEHQGTRELAAASRPGAMEHTGTSTSTEHKTPSSTLEPQEPPSSPPLAPCPLPCPLPLGQPCPVVVADLLSSRVFLQPIHLLPRLAALRRQAEVWAEEREEGEGWRPGVGHIVLVREGEGWERAKVVESGDLLHLYLLDCGLEVVVLPSSCVQCPPHLATALPCGVAGCRLAGLDAWSEAAADAVFEMTRDEEDRPRVAICWADRTVEGEVEARLVVAGGEGDMDLANALQDFDMEDGSDSVKEDMLENFLVINDFPGKMFNMEELVTEAEDRMDSGLEEKEG